METQSTKNPDRYEIRIQGHLELRRLNAPVDLVVTHTENGQTIFAGTLPDQAALYGVLNRLRDLGVSLISVNRVHPSP